MTRISSKYLFMMKTVFPLLWFGFLAVFVLLALFGSSSSAPAPFFIMPAIMAVFGFFMMKKLVWDLADEVYDGGDFLLVKRGLIEENIPLANIMNVSLALHQNPKRITLRLVEPCAFGNEVAFSPDAPFTLNPFAENKIAEDLMRRVDAARSSRK